MMAALDSAALARLVPGPWGQIPLGEILERSAMEFLVHTWGVAQAIGQVAVLDLGLVRDALGPARQFAPLARLSGLVGPECAVPEDADDLARLLAIFGRPDTSSKGSLYHGVSYRIFTVGRPSVSPQAMQRRRRDHVRTRT
jgi:hypothetical protein